MNHDQILDQLLPVYGLEPSKSDITPYGDGLINHTWKIVAKTATYILQQVNQDVFKQPSKIDENLKVLKNHLDQHYPGYLFVAPLPDLRGNSMVRTGGGYFRLFPFVEGSHSLNIAENPREAYEAAKQFALFSRLLNGLDVNKLHITLPDFHNLSLRYDQFLKAIEQASAYRKQRASELTDFVQANKEIAAAFKNIQETAEIPLRVVHHDTKINNVLFDAQNNALCVIDLDTVMPGYFISDVGDMMRTYLSPANEEEKDMQKIRVRPEFFKAIYDGYMQEMGQVLTPKEKTNFIYSGRFLIFMQGIRFLTDYLQNDSYYGARYEEHNLVRAENQFTLLKRYLESEETFREIMAETYIRN